MSNTQDILDPIESLEMIRKTMERTKNGLRQNAFYFIFWGLLVSITCVIHYLLIINQYAFPSFIVWPLLMTIGGAITAVYAIRQQREAGYSTHLGIHTRNLWVGIGIGYCIVLFLSFFQQAVPILPILLLSGIGTLVTGMNAGFTPLKVGGVLILIASLMAIWITGAESLLLCAVALIPGYVIPGLMIRNAE